ncbi:MAG: DUF4270 family protein [Adhaeribacter sp.]
MNWPTRTYILLFFAFISFSSCENPDVALDLEGETQLGTAFTDTITVKAATVLLNDSILGFKRGNLLTGKASDPGHIFGTTTAKAFTEVGLGTSTFTEPTTAVIDSMVLSLDYDEYYGDTTQDLTVRVHRLTQAFEEDQIYFANRSLTYEDTPLGTRTFKPRPKSTVKAYNADSSAIVRLPIPLRIKLDKNLAQQMLTQRETVLANQAAFVSFLPGFALTTGDNAESVLGFDPDADSTYIRIYYRSGGKKYQYNLFLSSGNNRLNQVSASRANTALAALQNKGDVLPATATNNRIYLQESTGLKGRIRFPYIKSLKEKLNGAYINRAELIMPVVSEEQISPYLYLYESSPSNLILRYSNEARAVSSDGAFYPSGYVSPAPLVYSPSQKAYILNVTSYVQALIYDIRPRVTTTNGTVEVPASDGLIVSPSSLAASTLAASGTPLNSLLGLQSLRQTMLNMAPGNQIKLRLYYSTKQ